METVNKDIKIFGTVCKAPLSLSLSLLLTQAEKTFPDKGFVHLLCHAYVINNSMKVFSFCTQAKSLRPYDRIGKYIGKPLEFIQILAPKLNPS